MEMKQPKEWQHQMTTIYFSNHLKRWISKVGNWTEQKVSVPQDWNSLNETDISSTKCFK